MPPHGDPELGSRRQHCNVSPRIPCGRCPSSRTRTLFLSALGLSAILSLPDSRSSSARIRESPLLRAAKDNDLCVLKKLLLDRNCDFRQRGEIQIRSGGDGAEAPAMPRKAL